ncbi:MAG: ATPase domain-containing protein [Candidatus Nitrosotenuis sp.]
MIQTGIEKLDKILGGGIRDGIIVDIFGASGTGKTHLALQIMINMLSAGGSVFYQDTTGSFRPERLMELVKSRNLDPLLLDRITVGRATNIREQIDGVSKIVSGDFTLAIVDSITDLFSFEYSKGEQMLEKNTQFAKYMRALAEAAASKKIPVIVVNMIRKIDQTERENMDTIIGLFTHVKIGLTRTQTGYEGRVLINAKTDLFSYKITKDGLTEAI